MAPSRKKDPVQTESFLPETPQKRTLRDLKPKKTTTLPEFRAEEIDLGFATLKVYFVSMRSEDGRPGYWTWRLCRVQGGEFATPAAAKWGAVRTLTPHFTEAARLFEPLFDKATNGR